MTLFTYEVTFVSTLARPVVFFGLYKLYAEHFYMFTYFSTQFGSFFSSCFSLVISYFILKEPKNIKTSAKMVRCKAAQLQIMVHSISRKNNRKISERTFPRSGWKISIRLMFRIIDYFLLKYVY